MGKTKKSFKNEIRTQDKTPLDEQILSGKVARSKNKVKIRLRAEEENVSSMMKSCKFFLEITYLKCKFVTI